MKGIYLQFIIILLSIGTCFGQIDSIQPKADSAKIFNSAFGGQIMAQGLFGFQYEHKLFSSPTFDFVLDIGIGFAELGQKALSTPLYTTVYNQISLNLVRKIRKTEFIGSIYPKFYFQEKISFIYVNAFLGVRFTSQDGIYFMAMITPRLYRSLSTGTTVFAPTNVGFRFGGKF